MVFKASIRRRLGGKAWAWVKASAPPYQSPPHPFASAASSHDLRRLWILLRPEPHWIGHLKCGLVFTTRRRRRLVSGSAPSGYSAARGCRLVSGSAPPGYSAARGCLPPPGAHSVAPLRGEAGQEGDAGRREGGRGAAGREGEA